MSSYRDFIQDYPNRCCKILKAYPVAQLEGKEVTLMLAMAATGINMPYERLHKPNKTLNKHPSDDREKFKGAKTAFDDLCKQKFCGSILWDVDPKSWNFGPLTDVNKGNVDTWLELKSANPIQSTETVGTVLKHLRNSLAHGGIFTKSENSIKNIYFLSKPDIRVYKFNYLSVAPNDFRKFLINWFGFTSSLDLS